jgi:NAD(P)-dependent dehydrogenase (short-subunit alcohol dehydrogenase family)
MTADLSVAGAADDLAGKLAGVPVDLLVNNAGFASYGRLADEDADRAAREIDLSCGIVVALTARLLPPMLTRRRGGVLNVASTAGFQPVPTVAVYGASKARMTMSPAGAAPVVPAVAPRPSAPARSAALAASRPMTSTTLPPSSARAARARAMLPRPMTPTLLMAGACFPWSGQKRLITQPEAEL